MADSSIEWTDATWKQKLDARGRKVSLPVLDGQQWAEQPEVRR